jgi:predicted nucleic acid-binding protein
MSGFLLDTNVISEFNKHSGPDASVKRWVETTQLRYQFVSVIRLAEIHKGVELLAEGKRRGQLEVWLETEFERWFADRILPVDRKIAARWASLVAQGKKSGRPLPTLDSLIAATALTHDLIIVTRDTRDFEGVGVTTINPWTVPR